MFRVLHFLGVEVMKDGAEGQAVPPGCAEVGDLYPLVTLCHFLTPLEERLAGAHQEAWTLEGWSEEGRKECYVS